MKQKTNIPRESFSPANHARYLLHGIWESDKVLMALMLLEMVCTVVTPFAALYLPKAGVELVTNQADTQQAALTLPGLTAVLLISQNLAVWRRAGKHDGLIGYAAIPKIVSSARHWSAIMNMRKARNGKTSMNRHA